MSVMELFEKKYRKATLLGLFDSLHLGHIKAVRELMSVDAHLHTVFTFKLDTYDAKGSRVPLLTEAQREEIFRGLGVDSIFTADFGDIRELSPEEFVDSILCGCIGTKYVLAGENFRFGKNAAGDAQTLKKLCEERGIKAKIIPLLSDREGVISTTRIRALLEAGEIEKANSLLGRRYSISGSITHGNALGRQWGIKTLNLEYEGCLKCGVYSTLTYIENKMYKSVTNIGYKPTVTDGRIKNCETHLLDFDREVYGEEARIELLSFYRSEEKFPDSQSLTEAIKNDIMKRREENE